jgi:hypothetical protein
MKIIRWILFLPTAFAGALVAKFLWDLSNTLLIKFHLGVFTQWLFWGVGEVIGILALLYIAIKIVPSKKKIIGYILSSLGVIFGLLTTGYVGYLLFTVGIHSGDPEFIRDLVQGTVTGIIEGVTSAFIFIGLKQGHLKHWII